MQDPEDTALLEDDSVDTIMPISINEKGVRA
jgi:hypothetical protein